MIIFFIYCVYKRLNHIKNILLYDLLINFDTRIKKCDIKMKYNNLRLYNIYIKVLILLFINIRYL